jgi:hypothetical protein
MKILCARKNLNCLQCRWASSPGPFPHPEASATSGGDSLSIRKLKLRAVDKESDGSSRGIAAL